MKNNNFLFLVLMLVACMGVHAQQAGDLDKTFHEKGIITLNISDMNRANAIAVQPDGKIVAVGTYAKYDWEDNIVIVRYRRGI